jgi:hypothetical protein
MLKWEVYGPSREWKMFRIQRPLPSRVFQRSCNQTTQRIVQQQNPNPLLFARGCKGEVKKGGKTVLNGMEIEDTGDFILTDRAPGIIESFGVLFTSFV